MSDPLTMFCMSATPFREGGALDEIALRAHLNRLALARNAVYLGGDGAGESHSLSLKELRRVYEIGVEELRGKVPIYAAVRESHTAADQIAVAKEAIAANVDAVLCYQLDGGHAMIPTQREQELFWTSVLDAIDHPVLISVHTNAGFSAPPTLLGQLCDRYPQIIGVNVIGLPSAYFMRVRDALPAKIKLYTGVAQLMQTAALGSSGAVLVENNVIPSVARTMSEAYAAGDQEAVARATQTIQRFANIVSEWRASARWIKMALKVLGLGNGVLRPPYVLPPDDDQRRMVEAFASLGVRELKGLSAVR